MRLRSQLLFGLVFTLLISQVDLNRFEEDNENDYDADAVSNLSQGDRMIERLFSKYRHEEDEVEPTEELERLKSSIKHIIHLYHSKSREDENVCVSPQCVLAAAQLINNMNLSANPCDDFHEYACGNFPKNHVLPDSETHVLSFQLLAFKIQDTMHSLIKASSASDSSVNGKMKVFYDACTDETTINNAGATPLVSLLKKVGTFPFQEAESPTGKYNVKDLLIKAHTLTPATPLFYVFVDANPFKASQFMLSLIQSGLGIERSYYLSDKAHEKKVLDAYKTFMVDTIALLGYKSEAAKKMMLDVFEFEKELAKITMTKSQLRKTDAVVTTTRLSSLRKIISEVDVVGAINSVLRSAGIKPVSDHYHISLTGAKTYFPALSKLLAKTNQQTLANYIGWKVVSSSSTFLSKSFDNVVFEYKKVLIGIKSESARWKSCLFDLHKYMPLAYGMLYSKKHFEHSNIGKVTGMIENIRKEFLENIDEVKWMDEKTKEAARGKARAILHLVGYPVEYEDKSKLDVYYKDVQMTKSNFFGSITSMIQTSYHRQIRQLLKKGVDRNEWEDDPSIVNAFYSSRRNRIVLPAGILQQTFYSADYPMSLNYGGIGTVAGHEITHGFDDHGRKFDSNGDLRLWWSKKSISAFEKNANCIRNQFSGFQLYGEQVKGNLTSGENIADAGGIKMAYRALKRWEQTHGREARLPGLQHLTSDQLYFLAYARIWCNTASREYVIKKIIGNEHAPSRFRIIGALQNSPYFARAYNCPAGSYMNPHKKCVIW